MHQADAVVPFNIDVYCECQCHRVPGVWHMHTCCAPPSAASLLAGLASCWSPARHRHNFFDEHIRSGGKCSMELLLELHRRLHGAIPRHFAQCVSIDSSYCLDATTIFPAGSMEYYEIAADDGFPISSIAKRDGEEW